jgi:hypothetical protein
VAGTQNFRVTLGVRADMPTISDRPPYNPGVDSAFGRRTDEIPDGNLQWSPRLGFNWDVTGDRRNQLRGGAGMFTGPARRSCGSRTPSRTRASRASRSSRAPPRSAPQFTAANVATPPTQCTNGTTARAGSEINL